MEREFTNALSNTPLWRFALSVYPRHQTALLDWQDRMGANINRLLLLAYAVRYQHPLSSEFYQDTELLRLEQLIIRVRALRRGLAGAARESAKKFELELEGLHLQRLNAHILLRRHRETVDPSQVIEAYEQTLGLKKGALAPFIETLIS